jgi:hypothetical protein
MTLEGWITLWSMLLWVSAGAFALVTLFVVVSYGRKLVRK